MISAKTFTVAKWEYLQKVKTKEFVISLILTPVIMFIFAVLPSLLASKDEDSTKALGILDFTGNYFSDLKTHLESETLPDGQQRFIIVNLNKPGVDEDSLKKYSNKEVLDKKLEGYLLISKSDTADIFEYRSTGFGNFKNLSRLEGAFNEIRRQQIAVSAGIPDSVARSIMKGVSMNNVKVTIAGQEEEMDFGKQFFSSFIGIIVLFFVLMTMGGTLIRSLLEEKSNRLIEIIVSSCKSSELMLGKIIGLTFLVLTQLAVWSLLGIAAAGGAAVYIISIENLLLILTYFISGFFLYVAIFVGIGSIVSTEQEAQQITGYMSMLLIFPVVILVPLIQNPDMMIVKVLSYFPLTTTPFMMVRINLGSALWWEHLIAIPLMFLSVLIMVKISAKIFRIGILSYGKMPGLKEIINWLKYAE